MSETVVITGGAGFIGSHTAELLLEQGYAVRVVDSLHPQVHPAGDVPSYLASDVEVVRGDVRNSDLVALALRGADHLIHLAAETSVGQSMYLQDRHVSVNALGTSVVLRAALDSGTDLQTVVLSSSRAVYGEGAYHCESCGPSTASPRRSERLLAGLWLPTCSTCERPMAPIATDEHVLAGASSVYGMTKRFQEQICEMFARHAGGRVVALRYFNVYGPRQSLDNPYTGLITTLATRLLTGKTIFLYEEGLPVRDFVHVSDVARANLLAIRSELSGFESVNVGSGHPVTLRELAAALATALGVDATITLTTDFRVGDIFASRASLTRARNVLRYEPSIGLEEGLVTIADWLHGREFHDSSDRVTAEMKERGVLLTGRPA